MVYQNVYEVDCVIKSNNKERLSNEDTKIYMAIKEAIQSNAFPPGFRLIERDLAKQFGTSRTPVRSAINRLTVEGYIDQSQYKGAIVKRLSSQDIERLLEVREALEGMACRLAAEYVTDEDKTQLQNIINDMYDAVEQNDFLRYYGLSGELHTKFMECCNNPYLFDLAQRVNIQTTRFQFRIILVPGRIKKAVQEHKEIVEKVINGDGVGAEECMRKHIRIVKDILLSNKDDNNSFMTF